MGFRIVNPYTLYISSFLFALLVYQLDWSTYFPPLSTGLWIFFLCSFALFALLARYHWSQQYNYTSKIVIEERHALLLGALMLAGWCIEFIYNGGVPLIDMLAGRRYDYRLFGVPTFHVAVVTFTSFCCAYLFHAYLSRRHWLLLVLWIMTLLAPVLIINRGMLMLNLTTCAFIFILSREHLRVTLRKAIGFLAACFVMLFLFGVIGNFRLSNNLGRLYDRDLVFESGEAREHTRSSWVPSEFFWTYFYVSAPLGNLQHNVNHAQPRFSLKQALIFINNELLPDAISKRVNRYFDLPERTRLQVADHLNASTYFGGGYYYMGWAGMAIQLLALVLVAQAHRFEFLRQSRYFVTCLAVLNTMFTFLIFDNMLVFTGFSFQLFYPIALAAIEYHSKHFKKA